GGDQLPGRGQRYDSHERMDRGTGGAAALSVDFGGDVRGSLRTLRPRAQHRANNRVSRDAGVRRRRDDATFAGDYARDVSRRGTYARDDDLRHRNDGRARHRPDTWWMDNRELQLALEFLHQRSGRFARGNNGVRIRTRPTLSERPTPGRQGGLPGD